MSEPLTLHGANLRIPGLIVTCKVELACYTQAGTEGALGAAPPILNFGARREWVVKATPQPFTPVKETRYQM